ncbi:DUF6036 family nucleotidyltransferase [Ramlibacter albus]|uniref:DUF6036 domain-containing protein n=1 Tax=Ramlibacter albus TaxID=2079448 RepID=A0A923M397_9BURK|nr:DUF6036 family nucleotidyltransferase [Ramlibacter albus]MBC5763362.1 hypothetical protein [Ramlibacter albus]
MNREEVEHVLRAAAAITKERSFVVVGSQAILLIYPDAPAELRASRELDLYPALHPEKADLIDGAIGALSSFDETFGYHADGVGPETAVMPPSWQQRSQLVYIDDVTVICPEVHDLAVSKCVAAREKDAEFVRALFSHRMIDLDTLLGRISELGASQPVASITAWARRRAQEARSA